MCNGNIILLEFFSWMKEIISHPNTPAYIQAIAVMIATFAGLNYLKKRAAEKKFDLVVETYKCCHEVCDVLISLKQPPFLFRNRDNVEFYENINRGNFVGMVSSAAESYLDFLKKDQELFDNLYHFYAEMRLFFNKDKEKIKPLEDLLYAKNRIEGLLENLKNSKELIKNLTGEGQDEVLKIIRNAMVQIWENIELSDWQKEYEKKEEEIDGIKGVRKYYYLNDLIKKARSDIDEIFPELINSKTLSK